MVGRRSLLGGALAGLFAPPLRAAPAEAAFSLPRSLQWEMLAGGDPARPHRILLAWPEAPPPPSGYPVLYLLDGQTTFPIAVAAARQQAGFAPHATIPPSLLVGLASPSGAPFDLVARRRDYTPPSPTAPPGSGAVEAFLDFIEHQVQPAIAQRFPLDPARQAIFGHSLGGLCVLHAFFTRPHLFRRGVAASPSLWWQDGAVLAAERRFTASLPPGSAQRGLLIAVGREEEPAPGTPGLSPERLAQLQRMGMVSRARALAERLAALGPAGPETRFIAFEGEDHGSLLLPALGRGLRFALSPNTVPG